MSHLCRLVPRTATNILYVSRMNAHNLPPGTPVKVPEAKGGHHIVSGSGQFIATDGPSGTKSGIGGGSSASTLPGSQTAHDHTNPAKTTGDSKQSHSKDPSDKAYEQKHSRINRNSSSSSFSYRHQSILSSPVGQFGVAAVALVSICKYEKKKEIRN